MSEAVTAVQSMTKFQGFLIYIFMIRIVSVILKVKWNELHTCYKRFLCSHHYEQSHRGILQRLPPLCVTPGQFPCALFSAHRCWGTTGQQCPPTVAPSTSHHFPPIGLQTPFPLHRPVGRPTRPQVQEKIVCQLKWRYGVLRNIFHLILMLRNIFHLILMLRNIFHLILMLRNIFHLILMLHNIFHLILILLNIFHLTLYGPNSFFRRFSGHNLR